MAEFVKQARQQPNAFNVAHQHAQRGAGGGAVHEGRRHPASRVPYKGASPGHARPAGGPRAADVWAAVAAAGQAKSGALRVLAVLEPERNAALPGGTDHGRGRHGRRGRAHLAGVYTAAKAPEAAYRGRLAADIAATINARPEMRGEPSAACWPLESATPQDLASTITRELAVWSSLVDEYKLTAD